MEKNESEKANIEKKNSNSKIKNPKNDKKEKEEEPIYKNIELPSDCFISSPIIIDSPVKGIKIISSLNNGILAVYGEDKVLRLYKPEEYNLFFSMDLQYEIINCITQLKDNRIAICAGKVIRIIKILNDDEYLIDETLTKHKANINMIIELDDGRYASCSEDKRIIIWKYRKFRERYCKEFSLKNELGIVYSIFQVNDKEIIGLSSGHINFWNINTKEIEYKLDNFYAGFGTNIFSFIGPSNDNSQRTDLLAIAGFTNKGIYILKISTHEIVKNIDCYQNVLCIYKTFNSNYLTMEEENNNIYFKIYKFVDNNNEINLENCYKSSISDCLFKHLIQLKNGNNWKYSVISVTEGKIYLWENNNQ